MKKRYLLFILILIFLMNIDAIEVDKKTVIPKKENYNIADKIKYNIVLKKKDEKIKKITPKINQNNIELINKDIINKKDKVVINFVYQIFDLDVKKLPDMEIQYTEKDKKNKLLIEGIKINIEKLTSKKSKLNSIESVEKDIKTNYSMWSLIFTILIIFVLGFIIYFVYNKIKNKKGKKRENINFKDTNIDPIKYICSNWEKIDLDKKIENKKYVEIYLRVTEILRKFLSYYYERNYIDMTTFEFKNEFDENIDNKLKKELFRFLTFSDRVKFAKYIPDNSELKYIKEFMDRFIGYFKKIEKEKQNEKERD